MVNKTKEPTDLSNVNYVPIEEIPTRGIAILKWKSFFDKLPDGKAALFKYNNKQRAHHVRNTIRFSAHYHNLRVKTRIIHGTLEIHGTDEWLLYVWKDDTRGENDYQAKKQDQ